jgi:protein-tyrosine phosphatase
MAPFLSKCYWLGENLLAGATFCGLNEAETIANLDELEHAGIKVIISLVSREELVVNISDQLRVQDQIEPRFTHYVFPLRDGGIPTPVIARQILDTIDLKLSRKRWVYLHCIGGRGRTGTIAGCWLARHGWGSGEEALEALTALRRRAGLNSPSPENELQRDFVRRWRLNQ